MGIQALILAAGRGSRLGNHSAGVPKPLLEVGRSTLAEHQLDALAMSGVGPVGMVVGYASDEIESALGIKVEYIYNPRWATTNSLYSFSLSRSWVTGDLLILNCDVLFDREILERLLEQGGDCIAYDSSSGDGREQMKVALQDGRLTEMSKTLDPAKADGENVGMIHLRKECVDALFKAADELIAEGQSQAWLGAALQRVAQRHPIRGIDIAGLPWGEIDFTYDLDRARREVWPAIHRRSRRSRPLRRASRFAMLATVLLAAAAAVITGFTAPPLEWETVAISGLDHANIEVRGVSQEWHVLAGGQLVELAITGPTELSIETRLVLSDSIDRESHYVIVTALDDSPEQWRVITTRPSSSAHHASWRIAKRDRDRMPIAEGTHQLRLRLEGSAMSSCLVHIRQLSDSTEN